MTNKGVCSGACVEIKKPNIRELGGGGDEGVEGSRSHDSGIDWCRQGEGVGGGQKIRVPDVDEAVVGRGYE